MEGGVEWTTRGSEDCARNDGQISGSYLKGETAGDLDDQKITEEFRIGSVVKVEFQSSVRATLRVWTNKKT